MKHVAKEALVPATMMGAILVYLVQTSHLSFEARAFPYTLIVFVGVASLVLLLRGVLMSRDTAGRGAEGAPLGNGKAWALVLVPVPLILVWRYVGALPVLFVIAFGFQIVLGQRRLVLALVAAASLTTALYALFKLVLYVRLPVGALGLGF